MMMLIRENKGAYFCMLCITLSILVLYDIYSRTIRMSRTDSLLTQKYEKAPELTYETDIHIEKAMFKHTEDAPVRRINYCIISK